MSSEHSGDLPVHGQSDVDASPGTLGRKGALVAGGTLSSAVAAAILSTILARQLGANGFGTYSVILATAGLLAAIAGLGLGPLLVRNIARTGDPASDATPRSATIEAGIVVGIAAVAISLALFSPIAPRVLGVFGDLGAEFRSGIVVLMASMAGYAVITEAFRGLFRFGPASYLGLPLQRLTVLGTVIALLALDPRLITVERVVYLTAAAAAVSLVVALVWLANVLSASAPGSATLGGARALFMETMPLAGATIVRFAIGKLPIWVLAAFAALSDVGVFAFATAVVALIALIQVIATKTLTPFVAQMYQNQSNDQLEAVLASSAALATTLTALAGAVVVPLLIVAGPALLGEDYAIVPTVVGVLVIRSIIVTYSGSCGLLLSVTGHQRSVAIVTGIEAVVATGLLVVTALFLGVVGAATAVTIASAVGRFLMWILARRQVGIDSRARFGLLTRKRLRGLLRGP